MLGVKGLIVGLVEFFGIYLSWPGGTFWYFTSQLFIRFL